MEPPPPTYWVRGHELRTKRMRQGRSVRDVAGEAGISRSYLQRLETGARQRMTPEKYIALRTALHAQDDELLADREEHSEKR